MSTGDSGVVPPETGAVHCVLLSKRSARPKWHMESTVPDPLVTATINHNPTWRLGSTQEGILVLSEGPVGPEKEKNSFRPSGNVMSPPFPLSDPFLAR